MERLLQTDFYQIERAPRNLVKVGLMRRIFRALFESYSTLFPERTRQVREFLPRTFRNSQ